MKCRCIFLIVGSGHDTLMGRKLTLSDDFKFNEAGIEELERDTLNYVKHYYDEVVLLSWNKVEE